MVEAPPTEEEKIENPEQHEQPEVEKEEEVVVQTDEELQEETEGLARMAKMKRLKNSLMKRHATVQKATAESIGYILDDIRENDLPDHQRRAAVQVQNDINTVDGIEYELKEAKKELAASFKTFKDISMRGMSSENDIVDQAQIKKDEERVLQLPDLIILDQDTKACDCNVAFPNVILNQIANWHSGKGVGSINSEQAEICETIHAEVLKFFHIWEYNEDFKSALDLIETYLFIPFEFYLSGTIGEHLNESFVFEDAPHRDIAILLDAFHLKHSRYGFDVTEFFMVADLFKALPPDEKTDKLLAGPVGQFYQDKLDINEFVQNEFDVLSIIACGIDDGDHSENHLVKAVKYLIEFTSPQYGKCGSRYTDGCMKRVIVPLLHNIKERLITLEVPEGHEVFENIKTVLTRVPK